tara:strand:+ start:656 stop:1921 length:1266 start_codon:yes stop_codon:yes gene_type:complete
MTKESWSCESLHHAVYAAPDVLRHCCKRFFVDGNLKGDVEIHKVSSDTDISYDSIREKKVQLHRDINSGKNTACSGCPWLVKKQWPDLENLELNLISIEHHSVCNLRCTYCSDMYYGGKKPSYSIRKLFDNLSEADALSKKMSLIWGGGEPVIFGGFNDLFRSLTNRFRPNSNHVFTNAIKYSLVLEEYLKSEKVTVTISMDAGTPETFLAVRGRNRFFQVLENLELYCRAGSERVIIKYILMETNSSDEEIESFVSYVKKYNLTDCSFQISADFKDEVVAEKLIRAAKSLYDGLRELEIAMVNYDYHLRPRMAKVTSSGRLVEKNSLSEQKSIIVWGAGEYAIRLMESKQLSERVKFFVDSDISKCGEKIAGKTIYDPKKILEEKSPFIFIASSQFYGEICKEIVDMGLNLGNIIDADTI